MRRGDLDTLAHALRELAVNRLRLATLKKVRAWLKAVEENLKDREELRAELVKARLVEGKEQLEKDDPGYKECVEELNSLFSEEVALACEPIEIAELPESVELSGSSLEVLEHLGVVRD